MKALPKFSVGEVIILQSVEKPEMNGEDTVIEVIQTGGFSTCRITGGIIKHDVPSAFTYKLEKSITTFVSVSGKTIDGTWSESALRKKHQPGEMSFSELVSSLKVGEKV